MTPAEEFGYQLIEVATTNAEACRTLERLLTVGREVGWLSGKKPQRGTVEALNVCERDVRESTVWIKNEATGATDVIGVGKVLASVGVTINHEGTKGTKR